MAFSFLMVLGEVLYCSMHSGVSRVKLSAFVFQLMMKKTKQKNRNGIIFIVTLTVVAVSFKGNVKFFDDRFCCYLFQESLNIKFLICRTELEQIFLLVFQIDMSITYPPKFLRIFVGFPNSVENNDGILQFTDTIIKRCLLYTSPSPRDRG